MSSGERFHFTLIELLVVTGIIAVLAALLLPALGAARQRGYDALYISNLKQLGAIARMYLDESQDMMPKLNGNSAQSNAVKWDDLFYLYANPDKKIRDGAIFAESVLSGICHANPPFDCPSSKPASPSTVRNDYGVNMKMLNKSVRGVAKPTLRGFIMDIYITGSYPQSATNPDVGYDGLFLDIAQTARHHNKGSVDVLYFDMHSEARKLNSIPNGYGTSELYYFWGGGSDGKNGGL